MEKYLEMLALSIEIDVLTKLPYNTAYRTDSKLNNLKVESAIFMDDLMKVVTEKRKRLSELNGTNEIKRLNKEIEKLTEEKENKKTGA